MFVIDSNIKVYLKYKNFEENPTDDGGRVCEHEVGYPMIHMLWP